MAAIEDMTIMIVVIGVFTIPLVIMGYVLFDSAIMAAAKENAFFSFVQFTETISSSFKSESYASNTKINLYPNYILFITSFETLDDLEYKLIDGMKRSYMAVNFDSTNLIKQTLNSVSGTTNSIEHYTNYEELKKCIGTDCVCFGQTEELIFSQEYLIPNACVEVCWGQSPEIYTPCLEEQIEFDLTSREVFLECNKKVKESVPGKCQICVDYMNDFDNNIEIVNKEGFDILLFNEENDIKGFSHATKYSFIPTILSCKTINEIKDLANKEGLCSGVDIHVKYYEEEYDGFFGIISTTIKPEDEIISNQILIDLLELNFNKIENDENEILSCDSSITYLKTEIVE